jgi:hypothetical protein
MNPTREQAPEPFGYVSDGFADGLRFQHKPWPEMHMLIHSVAAVYSASQLNAAVAAARAQALDEAADLCETIDQRASSNAPVLCASLIRRLKVKP